MALLAIADVAARARVALRARARCGYVVALDQRRARVSGAAVHVSAGLVAVAAVANLARAGVLAFAERVAHGVRRAFDRGGAAALM